VDERGVERRGVCGLPGPAAVTTELEGQPFDVGDHAPQRHERARQHLPDGLAFAEGRLLAQQAEVVGTVYLTGQLGPGRQVAGDGAQQGGLSGSVLTDQPDPAAGLCGQVDAVEDRPRAEPDVEVADAERWDRGCRHAGAFDGARRTRRAMPRARVGSACDPHDVTSLRTQPGAIERITGCAGTP
jgi:hypothetical protein